MMAVATMILIILFIACIFVMVGFWKIGRDKESVGEQWEEIDKHMDTIELLKRILSYLENPSVPNAHSMSQAEYLKALSEVEAQKEKDISDFKVFIEEFRNN